MKRDKEQRETNSSVMGGGISRRSFLTGATAVGALAVAGGLAACSPASTNNGSTSGSTDTPAKTEAPASVDKTVDTDMLIVGCGGSGLACAVQAALNGTNFIVIEKNSQMGGNANFVEGMFAINSTFQQEQGIVIEPAEICEAELVRGQHRQNGAMWLDLCNNSADNIAWCQEQGVQYSGVIDDYHGGLFPTFHWFKDGKAAVGYVEPMIARVQELGVEVHLNTTATSLILADDGSITGVYAESKDDGVVQYNAKAVVLASGGFGGNPDVIAKQGWDVTDIHIVGSPDAAGDGYTMAMAAGVKDFLPDSAQSILYRIAAFPPIDFHNDALNPINGYFGIASGGPMLWVNEVCDRYTRENLTADNLVLECIPGKSNKYNFCVFDQNILTTLFATDDASLKMFNDALASSSNDTLFAGDTIADLAKSFDLDPDALQATVDRYNELCEKGADDDFGKPADLMVPLTGGPYYIAKLSYSFYFSVGGVTTDRWRRALNTDHDPIPGLYAIGNDGNMNYRNVYTINMPGTAFGNQVNSGREAANTVADYLKG